jgi:glycosyltransferase involved in cell wall biosynthesis
VTPLRIGVDARELLGDTTGVGRYLGELLRRWTSRTDAAVRRFVLFSPEPLTMTFPAGSTDARVLQGGRGTWWEQTQLRSAVGREPLHLFFAPAYTAPLGVQVPLAVTIHDISFVAHPEWFRAREGFRRRFLTRRAASRASVIFTDSEFSRSELETRLRLPADRIRVISPGAPVSRPSAGGPALPREPLVLFVGSLFNRRRLPDLIAAFAVATRGFASARLVIVGADRTYPPQDLHAVAAAHGVSSRVDLRSYVPDDALAELYGRASVFAFLSEYEGFGLTPLEAMAAGVPPVVLDTPVAREIYGPAARYVRPGDVAGAAAALSEFLADRRVGGALLEQAPDVLARYSWERTADATLQELEAMVRR